MLTVKNYQYGCLASLFWVKNEPAHTVVHTRWLHARHWGILFSVGLHSLSYWLWNTAGDAVQVSCKPEKAAMVPYE